MMSIGHVSPALYCASSILLCRVAPTSCHGQSRTMDIVANNGQALAIAPDNGQTCPIVGGHNGPSSSPSETVKCSSKHSPTVGWGTLSWTNANNN